MDYGIFNVHTDVNAYDCTRGCADTVEKSALKVHSGRKIPCRTGESNLRRQRQMCIRDRPRVHAGCFSVSIIHRTLDMDYGIFNVRTYVNACDCSLGGGVGGGVRTP